MNVQETVRVTRQCALLAMGLCFSLNAIAQGSSYNPWASPEARQPLPRDPFANGRFPPRSYDPTLDFPGGGARTPGMRREPSLYVEPNYLVAPPSVVTAPGAPASAGLFPLPSIQYLPPSVLVPSYSPYAQPGVLNHPGLTVMSAPASSLWYPGSPAWSPEAPGLPGSLWLSPYVAPGSGSSAYPWYSSPTGTLVVPRPLY